MRTAQRFELNLYNKTRHSYIYVAYNRPNGWTEWAEIFCGHSRVAEGCLRLKKSIFFFKLLFFHISFPIIFIFSFSYILSQKVCPIPFGGKRGGGTRSPVPPPPSYGPDFIDLLINWSFERLIDWSIYYLFSKIGVW